MRNRIFRILGFMVLIGVLAYSFNFYLENFTGEGKETPQEALPTDADYEWIEGPKSEKEQRYFFLSNGNYFGTGTVTKNVKGWRQGESAYAKVPRPLAYNQITSAYSDSQILFGVIKRKGNVTITINDKQASFIELTSLSEDIIEVYGMKDYSIWYIELDELEEKESFQLKVMDEKNNIISELMI